MSLVTSSFLLRALLNQGDFRRFQVVLGGAITCCTWLNNRPTFKKSQSNGLSLVSGGFFLCEKSPVIWSVWYWRGWVGWMPGGGIYDESLTRYIPNRAVSYQKQKKKKLLKILQESGSSQAGQTPLLQGLFFLAF